MEKSMREAGFVNIKIENFKMPVSPWPEDKQQKEVGLYCYATGSAGIEGIIKFMYGNVMGWLQEEMSVYAAHLRREFKDLSMHGYGKWQVVYGQKPED